MPESRMQNFWFKELTERFNGNDGVKDCFDNAVLVALFPSAKVRFFSYLSGQQKATDDGEACKKLSAGLYSPRNDCLDHFLACAPHMSLVRNVSRK